jgi:large subunit ribosomal protein L4
MKLSVKDTQGKAQGELEVKFALIEDGKGTQAVHDTVVAYRAGQRSGTASTKNAGEVAGTNKKPWRQKGTGRARAGSFQSPLWRGGGVTFGPRPRDFSKKVNARTKQLALRKALSERLKAGDILVVDDLKLASPKTKEFLGVVKALDLITGTTLIVASGADKNLTLASRNVPNVALTTSESLNTYDVLRPDKLLFTRTAFEKIEARLTK